MNIELKFQDRVTVKLWRNYFKRVQRVLKPLPDDQKRDIMLELQSHLLEKMNRIPSGAEAERLLEAMEQLGEPEEYLQSIVADRLILNATKSYLPGDLIGGLVYRLRISIKQALVSLAFGLGYFISFLFLLMGGLKFVMPNRVGLFEKADGTMVLGILEASNNFHDVLGFWIVPIGMAISVSFYVILTRLLRRSVKTA